MIWTSHYTLSGELVSKSLLTQAVLFSGQFSGNTNRSTLQLRQTAPVPGLFVSHPVVGTALAATGSQFVSIEEIDMMTKWHVPFVAATLFSLCTSTNTFAQSPFDPVKDDPKLPRVLLIGDSISIGYTVPVQQLLKGKSNVHRIPVNGQYSAYGLENLKEWLGKDKWDVIHFNWGIWDTHLLDSNGEILSNEEEAIKPGKIRTTIAEYQKNLNKIIDILEPTGAKLIWANSTPITTRKGDHALSIAKYNKAAAKVMNLRRVAVDDLNGLITPHLGEMQDADGCHFSDQGYDYLGKQVAKHILAALNTGKGQSTLTWDAEQTGKEILEGRDVLRFEHECLYEWGYSQKERQYFFVVEPKVKDNGPLMVCLHSAGGNGQSEMPANVKRIADAGDDFTGLVLNSGPDSEWWWGADEIKAHPDKYKDSLTPVENRILATIEWVVRKYNIDRNRIYLRGISMGGSGTLGIGMSHGDIFAALLAGVPAGTQHAAYRLNNSKELKSRIGRANDVPPVFVFFSQKDQWSETMEPWLDLVHRSKLGVVAAWGPWGHENHYEMTNPAAYEFPWLSIRKEKSYT